MDNTVISVSAHSSKATHKVGHKAFEEIAELGGFGKVGDRENELSPDATLDLTGYEDSHAISDENKARIATLLSGHVTDAGEAAAADASKAPAKKGTEAPSK